MNDFSKGAGEYLHPLDFFVRPQHPQLEGLQDEEGKNWGNQAKSLNTRDKADQNNIYILNKLHVSNIC